ncbi:MAG: biliverdin-producing heme oxygenase [Pseudomonadota bacterium]|uniref:biliverdin-producing heme oxygenase n=1 Tax=Sphingobium sp. TaxID=1912891 RepID=UPI002E1F0D7E
MRTAPDAGRIRQALREATTDDHERVDAVYGRYNLDSASDYRAFLTAHARAVGALEALAAPAAPRLPLLRDDLAALGAPFPPALPVALSTAPGFVWGLRYALEGSRLGGAMLARRVGEGLPKAYLSAAHGKGEWAQFQREMDKAAAAGDGHWLDQAVQGARAAFALFALAGEAGMETVHG